MNILITGAGMRNKGAQSLTFAVTGELKQRYPNDNIILLVPDEDREIDYSNYRFAPFVCRIKSMFYLVGGIKKMMALLKRPDYKDVAQLQAVFEDARLLIDISGYALSSVWGAYVTRFYLTAIECAHKFDVPVYLMPQSFGPFDYTFPQSIWMNYQIKKIMKYPKIVYAREREGLAALDRYKLKNVKLSQDLVLLTKEVSAERFFIQQPQLIVPTVANDSVAVLSNIRLLQKCDKKTLLSKYRLVIGELLALGKNVYLMYHSAEDKEWTDEIAGLFLNFPAVKVIEQELSCLEYESTVRQFDFIVASRYHSIVHAVKQGVPAIAIGWAAKYQELLSQLDQGEYVLDARNGLQDDTLLDLVRKMAHNFVEESEKIKAKVSILQQNNILDCLDGE